MVDQPLDDGVVWLYDPALDADVHAPLTVGLSELFDLLEDVITETGIDQVVVTGTIQGLRRRPRWWSFDLVEMSATGETRPPGCAASCSHATCPRSRRTWLLGAARSRMVRLPR